MTNEKDSKHRGDHNRKERPVELTWVAKNVVSKDDYGDDGDDGDDDDEAVEVVMEMVVITVQSSDGGEESEDDHDHHAGDQVDQDLWSLSIWLTIKIMIMIM